MAQIEVWPEVVATPEGYVLRVWVEDAPVMEWRLKHRPPGFPAE